MTGSGNNTYLLPASDGCAVLVDAGVGREPHLAEIDAQLKTTACRLACVLVTHGHADHASGAPAIHARYPEARFAKYPWPEEDARYAVGWRTLTDGSEVALGDEVVTALHTPGHSPDHLAFWHEPTRTILSGDLV